MKHLMISLLLAGGLVAVSTMEGGCLGHERSVDFAACFRDHIWRCVGRDGCSAIAVGRTSASDSRDVVKMTTGLIGTLTALVLGLLIASAKTSFDQKTSQVKQMTATIILLDDLLTQYGPEATSVRFLLRQSIPPLANRIWQEEEVRAASPSVRS